MILYKSHAKAPLAPTVNVTTCPPYPGWCLSRPIASMPCRTNPCEKWPTSCHAMRKICPCHANIYPGYSMLCHAILFGHAMSRQNFPTPCRDTRKICLCHTMLKFAYALSLRAKILRLGMALANFVHDVSHFLAWIGMAWANFGMAWHVV